MTRIDFYFNVSDKSQIILELTQKAIDKQRRVMLNAVDELQAKVLSDTLWCGTPSSFLPHYVVGADMIDESILNFVPIVIAAALSSGREAHLHQDDLLINLQTQPPLFFSRFRQLIELVGTDDADKAAARSRYKFYRDRGYEIKSIDTSKTKSMT